ncbi:MAG: hypothetical protein HC817_02560 [Saprospiraceae bacterium]|nr:hypothetical protein [Saprospiraceae bacterium]
MMRFILFLAFVVILFSNPTHGQTTIFGTVKEAETEQPISYAQVVIYRYKTQEVVAFFQHR